ncbi:MAG: Holliday junction branch migration protein RuvA, partial [Prevotella sp.]|nr:Holliday junction branch migration protein RuvA [Prevotella sp.]
LVDVTPAFAVIEANGVGYGLNISLNTYSAIQGKKETRLWVYEAIREDAYVLFGFATKKEREMFLLLITVSGVGANTARMILSELSVDELCNVIATGNERILKGVKGIGLRTAQRIIVDLKDKLPEPALSPSPGEGFNPQHVGFNKEVRDEAVGALTMLGFAPAPSAKVVVAILKEQPDLPVEQVVKLALKQIK